MSVTAAKGFLAGAVSSGLKKNGNLDLTVIQNLGPLAAAAAVYSAGA